MAIFQVEQSADQKKYIIFIHGVFDYRCTQDFRRMYEDWEPKPEQIEVDMGKMEFVDSTGLGLLMMLRKHANLNNDIILTNINPDILKILKVSQFDALFDLRQ